ncbi:MAG: ABC transporter ATP-binding protein [Thermoanaerobaculia bacterium]
MSKLEPLYPYFRPYRRQLILGLVCVALSSLISMLGPIVIGVAIDALWADVSHRMLLVYGAAVVGVAAGAAGFRYLQRIYLVTMSRHIQFDLLGSFLGHLGRLHPGFYQEKSTGDLMARATNDVEAVRLLCGPAIMYGANTVFTATAAIACMIFIHPGLTLMSVATLPLVAVVTKVFGAKIHVLFERVQEQVSTLTTRVQENLAGARVVRAYAQEASEQDRFADDNREYVDRNRSLILWQSAFSPMLHLVIGVGMVAVLLYGGVLLIGGQITLGQFVMFNMFFGILVWPMIAIGWVINLFQRATASLGRIQAILDTEPAIRDHPSAVPVERIDGAIRFRDLSFAYDPGRPPALADLDLEVAAGETVAIVGRTGAGKSTLLSLIPRLVDPPADSLDVDGVDIRRIPLATLRGAIGMVPQETFLFSTTMGDNIAFGRPQSTAGEILRAADLAGLDIDADAFPKGLDTVVGERGITLSGGQKQRVALARALIRDPRILLLDDSLSAVDTETEERILQNLRTVFSGRTVFFVTHRVSAAQMADLIVVLDHGRIAERGSHRQLLEHGGLYADLHQRQQLEEQLAAAV